MIVFKLYFFKNLKIEKACVVSSQLKIVFPSIFYSITKMSSSIYNLFLPFVIMYIEYELLHSIGPS